MDCEYGQIVSWFDDKGFGFIQPNGGGSDVFLHAKEISPHQRRPRVGDRVRYALIGSETDKPRAARVAIFGLAWSLFSFACVGVILLLCAYAFCACRGLLPFYAAASLYTSVSLITIAVYHHDKRAALTGGWRIPESRLHLFELLGGWPGALCAQIGFRHKLRKPLFQIKFWLIVLVHASLWFAWGAGVRLPDLARQMPDIYAAQPCAQTAAQAEDRQQPPPEALNSASASKPPTSPSQTVALRPTLDWPTDSPTEPLLNEPSVCRTRVTADSRSRQAIGVIRAVSVSRGLLVTLPQEIGPCGVIDSRTLIGDFYRRVRVGEQVRVAVAGISMQGSSQQINLLLVETQSQQAGRQPKRYKQ